MPLSKVSLLCRGALVADEAGDLWVEGDQPQTFQPTARRLPAAAAAPAAAHNEEGEDEEELVESLRRLRENDATQDAESRHDAESFSQRHRRGWGAGGRAARQEYHDDDADSW